MSVITAKLTIRDDLRELVDENQDVTADLVASKVSPVLYTNKTSGSIPKLSAGSIKGRMLEDIDRDQYGTYKRVQYSMTEDFFKTRERGVEVPYDLVEDVVTDEYFNKKEYDAILTKGIYYLNREKRTADSLFSASTFTGAAYTANAATKWDVYATAIPRNDVDLAASKIKARKGIKKSQLSLVIPVDIFDEVWRCNDVSDFAVYTRPFEESAEAVIKERLAKYFGVKEIIIVSSLYNNADYALDAVFDELWDQTKVGVYYLGGKGPKWGAGVSRTMVTRDKSTRGKEFVIEEYNNLEANTSYIRCRGKDNVIVDKEYGYVITAVL